jgi:endonuclease G
LVILPFLFIPFFMKKQLSWLLLSAVIFLLTSCGGSAEPDPVLPPQDTTSLPTPSPFIENFENGTKPDYPSASIALASGKWNFTDALIGNTSEDKKVGSKSARLNGNGKISMNFDVINGVFMLVVSHARFGSDGPSDWQLWASSNSGNSYTQVGSTITASTDVLRNDTFRINSPGKIRFSIRKVSGSGNRINIDNVQILLVADPAVSSGLDNDNMLMGNPSGATPSIATPTNYFMNKTYYVVSYNRDEAKPNWVSWHLQSSDIGSTSRQSFLTDASLPSSWYSVITDDYTGSGFDRGHDCPSADRTSSLDANNAVMLMTNIIPQAPNLNQIAWARMEDSCRQLVFSPSNKELYVIMGSFGSGGTGSNGYAMSINNGKIVVPQYIWKVVVVLPSGNNDLSRIDANTRVIAVMAPNDNAASADWKSYRVSVDAIESATGYDLLSALPVNIQQILEARIDNL